MLGKTAYNSRVGSMLFDAVVYIIAPVGILFGRIDWFVIIAYTLGCAIILHGYKKAINKVDSTGKSEYHVQYFRLNYWLEVIAISAAAGFAVVYVSEMAGWLTVYSDIEVNRLYLFSLIYGVIGFSPIVGLINGWKFIINQTP